MKNSNLSVYGSIDIYCSMDENSHGPIQKRYCIPPSSYSNVNGYERLDTRQVGDKEYNKNEMSEQVVSRVNVLLSN